MGCDKMNFSCQIHSFGAFVPETALTNDDLAKIVDTNDQWIVERTGIKERRKLAENDNASDLGLRAALLALDQRNISPNSLTHIIVATCTPDHLSPSVACLIGGAIQAGPVMAFDISAACAGFIYGLSICRSILATAPDARILFVCAEALTRRLNWQDRSTCVLFGDGAVACVLSGDATDSICALEDVVCESDGKLHELIIVGGGTSCQYKLGDPVTESFFLSMQGRDTYKYAVRQMVNVCGKILKRNNLDISEIDLFVPHQANMRIIEAVGSRLGINPDKVFANVAAYGNTSAASIPLALAEARAKNLIKPGAKVLATAFGAGLTWGAALLRF